jgi:hypothetical protein
MVIGGISIKAIKLIVAVLGLSLLLVACGSAINHETSPPYGKSYYEGKSSYGHYDDKFNHNDHSWNYDDRNWDHNGYDWLSPGGYYSYYRYPTTSYYYNSYFTPIIPIYTNTYFQTYPVVYHDWDMDPWWGANVYGFGSTGSYYYSGSHWTYNSGFGFGDP